MAALRIVVIGGVAAGPKAAARARRLAPDAEITVVQREKDLSMASCGYPYYVGGVFDDRNQLVCTPTGVVRDPSFFQKAKGIIALNETEATAIDRKAKTVTCKHLPTGEEKTLAYDRLILATGAEPIVPPVPGTDLEGVTTLQSIRDADRLRAVRDEGKIKEAVVVGGGLIGMETFEALHLAGIKVTVVELMDQILGFLDWEMARFVEKHARAKGAEVILNTPVTAFLGVAGKLTGVRLADGREIATSLAVIAVGVKPNGTLAAEAGLEIGARGGIKVDTRMRTTDPDIYAAGDCCEIPHRITGEAAFAPYGDLANLQGRVAATNAVLGNETTFPGTIQTGICKICDYAVGATGLSEKAARAAGYGSITTVVTALLDKPPFMGAGLLVTKMVADNDTGRVLGVQCAGPGDASKRIATAAVAVQAGMTVEEMVNLDLPYAPPYSQAIDAVITTAHVLENKMQRRMDGISPVAFKEKLDRGDAMFVLDVRGPDEYEQMRLGVGETLVPLGALRSRMDELPEDRNTEIVAYCKISLRGYEAARYLQGQGYTNVKVLEGGIMAWPYEREA